VTGLLGLAFVVAVAVTSWPTSHQGRTIRQWLELAARGEYPDRQAAAAAFRTLGERAVPDLTAALRTRDTFLTKARDWLVRRVFRGARSRLPASEHRAQAAWALSQLGPAALPAARALVEALGDENPLVVAEAGHALGRIGAEAIPAVVRGLTSTSTRVRLESAVLLAAPPFNTESQRWADAMEAATRDPAPEVRAAAIAALRWTRDAGRVVRVARALDDPDWTVRFAAAQTLGEPGPAAAAVAPALRRALTDPEPPVRIAAARGLWRVTGDPAEAVATLQVELAAPAADYRAALAIAEIGPAAEPVVPELLQRLETETVHRPSRTPSPTALALGRVGPAAVPGLIALLDHPRTEVRVSAAVALRMQESHAAPALPPLLALLDHPSDELRITAVEALGAIGPAARPALPRLRHLSREATDYLRAAAVSAVERIETRAPQAVAGHPHGDRQE
jgi:HEAT repeat protein